MFARSRLCVFVGWARGDGERVGVPVGGRVGGGRLFLFLFYAFWGSACAGVMPAAGCACVLLATRRVVVPRPCGTPRDATVLGLLTAVGHVPLNTRDFKGDTPVIWAAFFGQTAAVVHLLSQRVAGHRMCEGQTAMRTAATVEGHCPSWTLPGTHTHPTHTQCCRCRCSSCCCYCWASDEEGPTVPAVDVTIRGEQGLTAEEIAVSRGHGDVARLLEFARRSAPHPEWLPGEGARPPSFPCGACPLCLHAVPPRYPAGYPPPSSAALPRPNPWCRV